MKRIPLFLYLALFVLPLLAETPVSRRNGVTADAAASDFKIMNKIFSEAHATAFGQIPAGTPPEIFKDAKNVAVRDFVVQVLKYYRGIHVDHTGLGFSPELIRELDIRNSLFPFPLKFFDGRAYFDGEYQDIPYGTELTQLNGEEMPQLLASFDTVTGAKDGAGKWDDYRVGEHFSFLYYIARGVPKTWRLTLAGAEKEKPRTVTIKISAGGNPPAVQRHSALLPQYGQPLYSMFNPSLKGAYLALNSFMPAAGQLDSIESWNNHLNLFHLEAKAKKSEYLVIDLRQNRGGVMLFSAAAATWFIQNAVSDRSRSGARTRVLPYREYAQSVNVMPATEPVIMETEKHLQTGFADKMTDGYFGTRQNEARFLELTPIPVAHKFKKIFVLTGPATYSAAVNFARLLKIGNKNVTIVGEETGSPGDGHSAEILVTYKLPATGLLFEIPLVRVAFDPLVPEQKPRRGLMPDVTVRETAEDFAAQRDAVLEQASRLMLAP